MAYDSELTATDVKEIFDTGLDNSALGTWIAAAESKVDELPEHADLDSDQKEQITKFLAAGLATAQDPRVDEEQHETATISYAGERMRYIDVAAMLDPTNTIGGDSAEASVGTFEVR